MADSKLVEILRHGSEVWNSWREQQPEDLQIDLSNINLQGVNLAGANLYGTNLSSAILVSTNLSYVNLSNADLNDAFLLNAFLRRANLIAADLCGSNLVDADLREAHLIDADLREVDLTDANLGDANLNGADLRGADLNGANLSSSSLEKTDWTNTIIGGTLFTNIDLRGVLGLETLKHNGPSTIGLDTIYRSRGQIPEVFLRGCGVPETFITNMRALVDSMSPIDYYTCFISYSYQNEDFAKRLHADLQAQGVRCWFAEEDLKIGDHYHQRIDEAIRLYDKLILVLSDAAVQSAWVEREVVAAREKEDRQGREVLFPLRLDDAVMDTDKAWAADVRRRWHIGDFTFWKDHDSYQQAFERLLRDLKAEEKRESNG